MQSKRVLKLGEYVNFYEILRWLQKGYTYVYNVTKCISAQLPKAAKHKAHFIKIMNPDPISLKLNVNTLQKDVFSFLYVFPDYRLFFS